MTKKRSFSTAFTAAIVVGVGGMWIFASPGQAQNRLSGEDIARMIKGYQIAPMSLNLAGKNLELVGLGSYIVNGQGDCNGCHSAGPPTQYTPTGNPYQLSPPFSDPINVKDPSDGRWMHLSRGRIQSKSCRN